MLAIGSGVVAIQVVYRSQNLLANCLGRDIGISVSRSYQCGNTCNVGSCHWSTFVETILVAWESTQDTAIVTIIKQTAGSGNVNPCAIVWIWCHSEVVGHRTYGYHFFITRRVEISCCAIVTGCKKHDTSHEVLTFAVFSANEVIDSVHNILFIVVFATPTPWTVGDRSTTVGCIYDSSGKIAFARAWTWVKHLNREQANARAFCSVTTCNTTHADAIVVDSTYGAGNVGAVCMGINVFGVGTEVPTIYVVDVTVTIVIGSGFTVELGFVEHNIVGKVFVSVVNTAVNDCDNCIFSAGVSLPRFKEVDVGTNTALRYATGVVVVPLLSQSWVVKWHFRGTNCSRMSVDNCVVVIVFKHHGYFAVCYLHACSLTENKLGFKRIYCFVKCYLIPAVKPVFGHLSLKLRCIRKHPANACRFYSLCSKVKCRNACWEHSVGLCTRSDAHRTSCRFLQLDANNAFLGS